MYLVADKVEADVNELLETLIGGSENVRHALLRACKMDVAKDSGTFMCTRSVASLRVNCILKSDFAALGQGEGDNEGFSNPCITGTKRQITKQKWMRIEPDLRSLSHPHYISSEPQLPKLYNETR